MTDPILPKNGESIPHFLYGTAWKEERTGSLVRQAIESGFRAIDTANQRKHYFELAVGQAISKSIESGIVHRAGLFLQSKYTFLRGQDERLPYDPAAPIAEQVAQSFASSLDHLNTDYLDSYVLHGPSRNSGLVDDDWAAWRAMESIQQQGGCRFLGISNVQLDQLQALVAGSVVPPAVVQNRCHAVRGWDRKVRGYCAEHDIVYQGFSLLTANRDVWESKTIRQIANQHNCTPAQVVFRFAARIGMLPLTGTSNPGHMRHDLASADVRLSEDEVARIESVAG